MLPAPAFADEHLEKMFCVAGYGSEGSLIFPQIASAPAGRAIACRLEPNGRTRPERFARSWKSGTIKRMTLRQAIIRKILPPFIADVLRATKRLFAPPREGLTYAPLGWETRLPDGMGFGSADLVACDLDEWEKIWKPFIDQSERQPWCSIPGKATRVAGHEDHESWMKFSYALMQAAEGKRTLRILDYGGGLGTSYVVSRTLLPHIPLEFHCKEIPQMADPGRKLNPGVNWHEDDSCLGQDYDLIVLSGVLQYVKDWESLLQRVAAAARSLVYVADTPIVLNSGSYIAVQRLRGASMLAQQFNKSLLMKTALSAGLRPVREFSCSEHERIAGAPEQPSYFACLFGRTGALP